MTIHPHHRRRVQPLGRVRPRWGARRYLNAIHLYAFGWGVSIWTGHR